MISPLRVNYSNFLYIFYKRKQSELYHVVILQHQYRHFIEVTSVFENKRYADS